MPIQGIAQPAVIQIRQGLRLTAYDGKYDFAYDWYQDEETIYLVDGIREPYSHQKLKQMYEYLNSQGELYFIPAGNEPSGHACMSIWRLPRGSNTPQQSYGVFD